MKNFFLAAFALFAFLLAVTVYATDKITSETTIKPSSNSQNEADDVQVESEDDDINQSQSPEALVPENPDAVEQSEDVEEFKGNVDDLNKPDVAESVDGEVAPPSDDPHADEKYQQTLQECERKAEDSGDFNASLRKCMEDHGLGQDLSDAENNVF